MFPLLRRMPVPTRSSVPKTSGRLPPFPRVLPPDTSTSVRSIPDVCLLAGITYMSNILAFPPPMAARSSNLKVVTSFSEVI